MSFTADPWLKKWGLLNGYVQIPLNPSVCHSAEPWRGQRQSPLKLKALRYLTLIDQNRPSKWKIIICRIWRNRGKSALCGCKQRSNFFECKWLYVTFYGATEHRKLEKLNINVNFLCIFTLASSTLWFFYCTISHFGLHKRHLGLNKIGWTARQNKAW